MIKVLAMLCALNTPHDCTPMKVSVGVADASPKACQDAQEGINHATNTWRPAHTQIVLDCDSTTEKN